jgi:hypothetical protein
VIIVAELAVLLLPAASVNASAPTETDPEPDCVLVVGVKTTEYTVDDVVVSADSVPPEKVMSPTTKVDEASDNVKVIVSVWPIFSAPEPVRISDTVGTFVSVVRFSVGLQEILAVPGMSVKAFGPIHKDELPLLTSAVGVNVAVYELPEPARFVSDPGVAFVGQRSTSAREKSLTDSENVNVIVSVWPARIVPDPERAIDETVGAVVSTFCVDCVKTAE